MRNGQLERVLRLVRCLQRGRRTLESLARELNVTTRTVRRDLEVLSVAGFPVRHVRGGLDEHLWWCGDDGRCALCNRL